jgi:3,4-dihydroxy 2-butanone 4-phosphate synthase/GTP cyclohydrolase II
MARLEHLMQFAQKHRLKIGTIRDLIAYRRRNDHLIERRSEASFISRWGGEWRAISFYNKATGTEQVALQKGHISPDTPTLVRMHQVSLFADIFGEEGPRAHLLDRSIEIIAEAGEGIVVCLNRPEPDRFSRILEQHAGRAPEGSRVIDELRDYGVGAQILAELGVHDMIVLTNRRHNLIALDGYDLAVVEEREITFE